MLQIDWRHPAVITLLMLVTNKIIGSSNQTESTEEERIRRIIGRLDDLQGKMKPGSNRSDATVDDEEIRRSMTRISATLKEAGRFAREDGMRHPEVQQRLSDTEAIITDLERFQLSPERLSKLTPDVQEQARSLLPEIRRLRQRIYNQMDSPDSLDRAAGLAGEITTKLRLTTVTPASNNPVTTVTTVTRSSEPSGERPYSLYAPDMEIDTGCIPCGRAHLGGVQAELETATELARSAGIADPRVQARIASAEEELSALFAYDWTPERIARSPNRDREILERFKPEVESLQAQLSGAQSVDNLGTLSDRARQLRADFRAATTAT